MGRKSRLIPNRMGSNLICGSRIAALQNTLIFFKRKDLIKMLSLLLFIFIYIPLLLALPLFITFNLFLLLMMIMGAYDEDDNDKD